MYLIGLNRPEKQILIPLNELTDAYEEIRKYIAQFLFNSAIKAKNFRSIQKEKD